MKKQKTIADKVSHFLAYSDFVDGIRRHHFIPSWCTEQLIRFVRRVVREEKDKK